MRAYLLRKSGQPESLKIEEVPEPSPEIDEVKVKVLSIGINYAEILSRRGQYRWAPKRPYIPGMEAYGEVVEVGDQVTQYKVGDKVLTGGQFGAYAEYITRKEYLTFPAFDGLSTEQNGAALVSYMTAYVALVKLARMNPTDKVLIQAAAGGVGTAAVQIAKSLGATVFGTASKDEKIDLLKEMDVDHPINYASTDFHDYIKKTSGGVDVVLEVVGGEVFRQSLSSLNHFGRLVVVGYASIPFQKYNPLSWYKTWKEAPSMDIMESAKKSIGVMATHIGYLTESEAIAKASWNELQSFVVKHDLKPIVGKSFSFDDLPKAHAWVESRHNYGKTVVTLE